MNYPLFHANQMDSEKTIGWFYKLALLDFEPKTVQAEYNQTCLNC